MGDIYSHLSIFAIGIERDFRTLSSSTSYGSRQFVCMAFYEAFNVVSLGSDRAATGRGGLTL